MSMSDMVCSSGAYSDLKSFLYYNEVLVGLAQKGEYLSHNLMGHRSMHDTYLV